MAKDDIKIPDEVQELARRRDAVREDIVIPDDIKPLAGKYAPAAPAPKQQSLGLSDILRSPAPVPREPGQRRGGTSLELARAAATTPAPRPTAPAPEAQLSLPLSAADMLNVGVDAGATPAAPGSSVLDRPVTDPATLDINAQQQGVIAPPQMDRMRVAASRRPSPEAKPFGVAQNLAQDLREATDNPVLRGAASGFSTLGKTGVGAVRLAADLTGAAGVADRARGASQAADTIERGATSDLTGNDQLVAAVTSSILNSAPSVALGVAGGPALRTLFAQSTLAEYNAGRDAGFDPTESLGRAGIMGFAEALGERFGFGEQIKLLKSVTRTLPQGELSKVFGSLLAKEIPGEQLTTAVQFLADKIGPAALAPNAGIEDYLNAAAETLKVTVGQMAVMGGGPAALNTTRNQLAAADAAINRSAMSAPQRAAVDAGFFASRTPVPPTEAVSTALKRFDELAAAHGLNPKAAARAKEAAGRMPAGDVPGFLAKLVDVLSRRGLFSKPVDPGSVDELGKALDGQQQGAAAPAPEASKGSSGDGAAASGSAAPVDDFTGLAGSAPVIESPVDQAAHGAATSPTNDRPEPTEPQKQAGNYAKGHIRIGGLDVTIENPQGSVRRGVDPDGKPWESSMAAHYGYVKGTRAGDGDHSDVFIRPGTPEDYSGPVFVIDQMDPRTGKFDEHKSVIGVDTEEQARALYLANYDATGTSRIGAITRLPLDAFKSWVRDGVKRKPIGDTSGYKPDLDGASAQPPGAAAGGGDQPGRGGRAVGPVPAEPGTVGAPAAAPVASPRAPQAVGDGGQRDAALNDLQQGLKDLAGVLGTPPAQPATPPVKQGATNQGASDEGLQGQGQGRREEVAAPEGRAASAPPATKATAARSTHPKTVMGSPLLARVSEALGGLDPAWIAEFSTRVETGRKGKDGRPIIQWRNPLIPGVGNLFRAGGTQDLQLLAELLEREGYLEPGSVEADTKEAGERAKDLVRDALNRVEIKTLDQQAAEDEAALEAERDAYYAELNAESARELEEERQAIMAELDLTPQSLAAMDDDMVWEAAGSDDQAGLMRALGFTEEEIADELAKAQGKSPQGASPGGAEGAGQGSPPAEDRGSAARPGGQEGDGEGLTLQAQTTEDLKAKTEREARADELDQRAQVDAERERFGLEAQTPVEERKDTTVDLFGGPSAEDLRAAAERERAASSKAPSGPDLFSDLPDEAAGKITGKQWVSTSGQFPGAQLQVAGKPVAEIKHAGHPTALRPYYLVGPAIDKAPTEYGMRKYPTLADAKAAVERALDQPSPTLDELRAELRQVESQILEAAPKKLQAGGGDIEAAAVHPSVPDGLKVARSYIKQRIKALQGDQPAKEESEQPQEDQAGEQAIPFDNEAFADAVRAHAEGDDERLAELFQPTDIQAKSLPRIMGGKVPAGVKFMSPEEAAASLQEWRDEADRQGRVLVSENANRVVISLFDASGVLAQPWADAGYTVHTYDLQTGADISDFDAENLLEAHGNDDVYAILAQPPCTDFASSGARWWKEKDEDGRTKASTELVMQVLRTVELFRPSVWVMENPVGRIQEAAKLPPPLLQFDPWHYGDPYTKRTMLFGRFDTDLPTAMVEPTDGSKIHRMSSSAKYERSLTPEGFAYAFFAANNADQLGPEGRLAAKYAGVERSLFSNALSAGATEQTIAEAIDDSYYESDLETVREELVKLAKAKPEPPRVDKTRADYEREREEEKAQQQAQLERGEYVDNYKDEFAPATDGREPMQRWTVPAEDWPHLISWNWVARDLEELRVHAVGTRIERAQQALDKADRANRGLRRRDLEEAKEKTEQMRAALAWAEAGGAQRYPLPPEMVKAGRTAPIDFYSYEASRHGLIRRFIIKTEKGAVQVNIDASRMVFAQEDDRLGIHDIGVEMYGASISETGYKSFYSASITFDAVAADPYGFAERLVRERQEQFEKDSAPKPSRKASPKPSPKPAAAPAAPADLFADELQAERQRLADAERAFWQARRDRVKQRQAELIADDSAWKDGPFADRIRAMYRSLAEAGERGMEMLGPIASGITGDAKSGRLSEQGVTHRENVARNWLANIAKDGKPPEATWKPITAADLREDASIRVLPESLAEVAAARLNEMGPRLAKMGFTSWADVTSGAPQEARDVAQQMRNAFQSLMLLGPQRQRAAKGYKNFNPAKLEQAENWASEVLGVDTRFYEGVDTGVMVTQDGVESRAGKSRAASPSSVPPKFADYNGDRAAWLKDRVLWSLQPKNYGGKLTAERLDGIHGDPERVGYGLPAGEILRALDELLAEGRIRKDGRSYRLADGPTPPEPKGQRKAIPKGKRNYAQRPADILAATRGTRAGAEAVERLQPELVERALKSFNSLVDDLAEDGYQLDETVGEDDLPGSLKPSYRIAYRLGNSLHELALGLERIAGRQAPARDLATAVKELTSILGKGVQPFVSRLRESEAERLPNPVNGRSRAPDVKPGECLLLMPCGGEKQNKRSRADELYTGPMWQTLRKHGPATNRPRLIILSAEHGIVDPAVELDPYDRQMTTARANELIEGARDMARGIASAMRLGGTPLRDVQIVGGAEYRRVMRAVVAEMQAGGAVAQDASIREIAGEIGEQRQQLGQYLDGFGRAAPAWHTDLPTEGLPIEPQDATKYQQVAFRVADDAIAAITPTQTTGNIALQAYLMPASGRNHGRVRLVPEDQKPPAPWEKMPLHPIPAGSSREQLRGELARDLQHRPILGRAAAFKVGDEALWQHDAVMAPGEWIRATISKISANGSYWVQDPKYSNAESPARDEDLAPLGSKPETMLAPKSAPKGPSHNEVQDRARVSARVTLEALADRAEQQGAENLANRLRILAMGVTKAIGGGTKVVTPSHVKKIAERFDSLLERAKANPADRFQDVDAYSAGKKAAKSQAQPEEEAGDGPRDERTIELRKQLSVLRALRECVE